MLLKFTLNTYFKVRPKQSDELLVDEEVFSLCKAYAEGSLFSDFEAVLSVERSPGLQIDIRCDGFNPSHLISTPPIAFIK
jgi:hypothetical protein